MSDCYFAEESDLLSMNFSRKEWECLLEDPLSEKAEKIIRRREKKNRNFARINFRRQLTENVDEAKKVYGTIQKLLPNIDKLSEDNVKRVAETLGPKAVEASDKILSSVNGLWRGSLPKDDDDMKNAKNGEKPGSKAWNDKNLRWVTPLKDQIWSGESLSKLLDKVEESSDKKVLKNNLSMMADYLNQSINSASAIVEGLDNPDKIKTVIEQSAKTVVDKSVSNKKDIQPKEIKVSKKDVSLIVDKEKLVESFKNNDEARISIKKEDASKKISLNFSDQLDLNLEDNPSETEDKESKIEDISKTKKEATEKFKKIKDKLDNMQDRNDEEIEKASPKELDDWAKANPMNDIVDFLYDGIKGNDTKVRASLEQFLGDLEKDKWKNPSALVIKLLMTYAKKKEKELAELSKSTDEKAKDRKEEREKKEQEKKEGEENNSKVEEFKEKVKEKAKEGYSTAKDIIADNVNKLIKAQETCKADMLWAVSQAVLTNVFYRWSCGNDYSGLDAGFYEKLTKEAEKENSPTDKSKLKGDFNFVDFWKKFKIYCQCRQAAADKGVKAARSGGGGFSFAYLGAGLGIAALLGIIVKKLFFCNNDVASSIERKRRIARRKNFASKRNYSREEIFESIRRGRCKKEQLRRSPEI